MSGSTYIVGGSPNEIRVEPDPERLAALRHHAAVSCRQARERQSFFPGRRVPRARQPFRCVAGQTLQGVPRNRAPAADLARRAAGLCQGRGERRGRCGRARATRLDADARTPSGARAAPGRHASRSPSARAPTPSVVAEDDQCSASRRSRAASSPTDVEVTVTRNYGETANEKANELLFHLAPRHRCRSSLLIRIAIGWREGVVVLDRHPDDDPADALRLLADGLHDQPRQPVRADLLDRHPRRRRDRRRREHRPALGDAAASANSSRPRSRRSRRSAIRPSSRR